MVQIDASGSGGLVDPGVAYWVGISGELGAREERGMSAWQFAVMKLARALLRLAFDRSFQCPVHSGRKWYTLKVRPRLNKGLNHCQTRDPELHTACYLH